MSDAFYLPEEGGFRSTAHTVGPWSPDSQHAGPPAALLGRAMEQHEAAPGFQVGRATFEILRAVPIADLRASAELVRGGTTVQYVTGSLRDDKGEVMRGSLWRIRTEEAGVNSTAEDAPPAGPLTVAADERNLAAPWCGYCRAMEWHFIEGGFGEMGPATAWMRMRYPLVPGEEPSPLTRVLIAADSGNGISMTVSPMEFIFVNTELTVHLIRPASGEWVCLRSKTHIAEGGVGLAETVLYDEKGRIGSGHQALVIRRREAG